MSSRCHLCTVPLEESRYVETDNGLRWCPDLIECKFRAARRLGLPTHLCLLRKAADLEQLAARERERAERLASLPTPTRDPEYLAHINSPQWQEFAGEQKLLAKYRCEGEGCGQFGAELDAHHINYRRFGREQPQDVLVLCPICHREYDDRRRLREKLHVRIVVRDGRRTVTWPNAAAAEVGDEAA